LLSAGTGALILFAAVQLTMFIFVLRRGEHFTLLSWAGLIMAVIGVIYLVSPGLTAPDPFGAILMAMAGTAWVSIRCWAGQLEIHYRPRPKISCIQPPLL
jgi:drug/metabolite transporter (DMT)-like permease